MSHNSPAVDAALDRFKGQYPETIELSLGRIERLLAAMGNPHFDLPPIIHVAGTNGKGSTTAFMRAMAEAAGLKTHVFISPHLVRFNERIRLAGSLISDETLIDALNRTFEALDGEQITHFEATTAAAFLAFHEHPADVLLLEVGLGGRFDATNVIGSPALSVITPVDYDHKAFLGTDLAKIAWEKAGIIKPGTPVLTALQRKVCGDVIAEEAKKVGVPLYRLKAHFIDAMPDDLALTGHHQRANAALAGMAMQLFGNSVRISQDAIFEGARAADWPARMQKLKPGAVTAMGDGSEVWLDGGHNPHAARAIADFLCELPGETVLVSAMMGSKDSSGYFAEMVRAAKYVFTIENAGRHAGADPVALAKTASLVGFQAKAASTLEAAMAQASALRPARILICGSLYLAGDVLAANGEVPS